MHYTRKSAYSDSIIMSRTSKVIMMIDDDPRNCRDGGKKYRKETGKNHESVKQKIK